MAFSIRAAHFGQSMMSARVRGDREGRAGVELGARAEPGVEDQLPASALPDPLHRLIERAAQTRLVLTHGDAVWLGAEPVAGDAQILALGRLGQRLEDELVGGDGL